MSYHTLTVLVSQQRVHLWQYYHNDLSWAITDEMEVVQFLFIHKATVAFDVGANTRKECGVQILEGKISIREDGFAGRQHAETGGTHGTSN